MKNLCNINKIIFLIQRFKRDLKFHAVTVFHKKAAWESKQNVSRAQQDIIGNE